MFDNSVFFPNNVGTVYTVDILEGFFGGTKVLWIAQSRNWAFLFSPLSRKSLSISIILGIIHTHPTPPILNPKNDNLLSAVKPCSFISILLHSRENFLTRYLIFEKLLTLNKVDTVRGIDVHSYEVIGG